MSNTAELLARPAPPHQPTPLGRPRHILYVSDTFYGSHGGAEGALTRLIRSLPKDRYRASFLTFQVPSDVVPTDCFACPFHVLPLTRAYDWSAVKAAWAIRRLIQREHIDLVHTFHETSDIFGGLVAKLSGAKVISSRRDMGILRQPKHARLYRWMAPYYDQVHAVSEEVRGFMIQADGLAPERVVTVHNGIDLDLIDAAPVPGDMRKSLGAEHAEQLVVTVCNVRPVKGLETLLHCAAHVAKARPGVVFAIVGSVPDPAYMQSLEQLRDSLGITRNVVFPGRRHDVFSILKSADMFCLPSLSEGLSNALLEAMGAGLPAVATRVGGNPELVVPGETGFLVNSGDHAGMAHHILTVLNDPRQAQQMGKRARAIVEARFTTESMAKKVAASYDTLLGESR